MHSIRTEISKILTESCFFFSPFAGPIANAPIDTIKTRIQRSASPLTGWARFKEVTFSLIRNEGYLALYKGLLPRLMRVGVGQAVTFASYERIKVYIDKLSVTSVSFSTLTDREQMGATNIKVRER